MDVLLKYDFGVFVRVKLGFIQFCINVGIVDVFCLFE